MTWFKRKITISPWQPWLHCHDNWVDGVKKDNKGGVSEEDVFDQFNHHALSVTFCKHGSVKILRATLHLCFSVHGTLCT